MLNENKSKDYNLERLTKNLIFHNDIWFSKKNPNVSFPKEGYNKNLQLEENSFWFQHRNNIIIEILKNFPPSGVIYDIGGGNGYISLALQNKGIDTVLVEPGKNGAYNAKKRGLKNIICAEIKEIGFEQNSISAIGLFDVIEHIKNDQRFLAQLYYFLKKEGKLYITTPAYNFLWSDYDKYSGHFRRYTIRELSKILKRTGFKIEFKTYFFFILPIPIFLFRTLPSKLKTKKDPMEINNLKREHSKKRGLKGGMLKHICKFEVRLLKGKKRIFFGGSALIIARKI